MKLKSIIFTIFIAALCCAPGTVFSEKKPTLNYILSNFFHEKKAEDLIDKMKLRNNSEIKKLWNSLGFTRKDLCWTEPCAKEERCLFSDLNNATALPERRNIYYDLYASGGNWDKEGHFMGYEFILLRLQDLDHLPLHEQWLIFKRWKNDYVYQDSFIASGSSNVAFYNKENQPLFFSFENYYSSCYEMYFYRLINSKAKEVLRINIGGYTYGHNIRGEFKASLWPEFYLRKDTGLDLDLGFTYFFKYYVYGGYVGEYSGEGHEDIGPYLFSVQKDVVFSWDDNKKQYVFDAQRSQMTEGELDALWGVSKARTKLEPLKSDTEFYDRYKSEIKKLKMEGSEEQKAWVTDFEKYIEQNKGTKQD